MVKAVTLSATSSNDKWDENCPDKTNMTTTSLDVDVIIASDTTQTTSDAEENGNCCTKRFQYGGIPEAQGYALLAMGRGAAVMSNGMCICFCFILSFTIMISCHN